MIDPSDRAAAYAEQAIMEGMDPVEAVSFAVRAIKPTATSQSLTADPFTVTATPTSFLTLGAAIMRAREQPPVKWIVPGLLPMGLTMLAGPIKVGKSFLVLDLAFSVAMGGQALGTLPTNQCSVLYLALEDNVQRINQRLLSLEPDVGKWPLEDLALVTIDETEVGPLRPVLDRWYVSTPKPGLVILDTLGSYKTLIASSLGQQHKNVGQYDSDVMLLRPLQRWALDRQVSLLIVHHTNQSKWEEGDDWASKVSGTSGLTGTADQVMVLRGQRGAKEAELLIVGREIEDNALDLHRVGPWWMVTGGIK